MISRYHLLVIFELSYQVSKSVRHESSKFDSDLNQWFSAKYHQPPCPNGPFFLTN